MYNSFQLEQLEENKFHKDLYATVFEVRSN